MRRKRQTVDPNIVKRWSSVVFLNLFPSSLVFFDHINGGSGLISGRICFFCLNGSYIFPSVSSSIYLSSTTITSHRSQLLCRKRKLKQISLIYCLWFAQIRPSRSRRKYLTTKLFWMSSWCVRVVLLHTFKYFSST